MDSRPIRLDTQVNETEQVTNRALPTIALTCGVLGVLAAVWLFWLVVPGIVLGLGAVGFGWRSRRTGPSELASAAVALGIVALLLVPSVLILVSEAEDWGRDCALHPTKSDC